MEEMKVKKSTMCACVHTCAFVGLHVHIYALCTSVCMCLCAHLCNVCWYVNITQ
jgi:hypothetical protein